MTSRIILTALTCAALAWTQNSTPWTPQKRTASVSLSYVFDTYKDFRAGSNQASLPGNLSQNSFFAAIEYGVTDRISADLLTGYTRTKLLTNSLDGVADTLIGGRFKVYSGESTTFTIRAAGVVAGSYPLTNLGPFAPGFKASGFLTSGLVGKTLGKGFYTSGEFGFSGYEKPVSDRLFGNAVVGQSIGRWSYWGGYQQSRAVSGIDIGAPGFTPSRFPEINRIYGGFDAGAGYSLPKDVYLGVTYGRFLHGRNVGEKNAIAVTVGFQIPPGN